jgi:hypothetical protein
LAGIIAIAATPPRASVSPSTTRHKPAEKQTKDAEKQNETDAEKQRKIKVVDAVNQDGRCGKADCKPGTATGATPTELDELLQTIFLRRTGRRPQTAR